MNKKNQKSKIFELPRGRKGQGISINVIIIAAIAILVLIILAVLIARSGGNVSTATKCVEKGGTCKSTFCETGYEISGTTGVCGSGYCCSPVSLT
ncbi:MAG: hypothetical protein ABH828_02735 [archaeon]